MGEPAGAENIRWDLTCFYTGLDDPQLNLDIEYWIQGAKTFYDKYKGRLAETLPQAIRDCVELGKIGEKPMMYLSLSQSLNTGDSAVNAKVAEVVRKTSMAYAQYQEFFTHEVVALDDVIIAEHASKDEVVAKHLPWLEKIRLFKPHLLPEPIEAALIKRSPFGPGSWSEFFDEYVADLRFPWENGEKTLNVMLHIVSEHPDREVRARALQTVNNGLAGHFAKYSAQTLYMIAGLKETESRERGYQHPMETRNKSNRLPDVTVNTLHETVAKDGSALARRFYRLKAKILGLPTLKWSDRNAPLPFTDVSVVAWDKALETVLAAYQSFSPALAVLVEKMAANKWIDAPAVPGKHHGAFNSSTILSDGSPASFTLLNFMGTEGDVITLAHELGHGVHGLLSGEAQGPLMQDAPIALCETASVFGEMTTFVYLKEKLSGTGKDEAILALIMGKLDEMINTVVRQIGLSNFERRLHGWNPTSQKWEGCRKLSVEELDAIWLETVCELYGQPGEVFTYENAEHLWAYISHFHSPFYVYGYAFGELLAQSLYATRPRLGDKFEPLYLDMLRAGGTKSAEELLAPFGLDPADPAFWSEGLRISIGAMIEEAENLHNKIVR